MLNANLQYVYLQEEAAKASVAANTPVHVAEKLTGKILDNQVSC